MGLRPTNSDEKHAERRRPGERSVAPGRVFQGSVPWACGPPMVMKNTPAAKAGRTQCGSGACFSGERLEA